MTNGDYIRSMSDEMLARLMYKVAGDTDKRVIEAYKKILSSEYDKNVWEKEFLEDNEIPILIEGENDDGRND